MDPVDLIDNLNEIILTDHYTYLGELGKGSFGIVVEAMSKSIDKTVAIKITKQLNQEANILEECTHPNVVKLYKVLLANHHLYLIMEKLTGQTLDRLMHDHQLSLPSIRNIIKQVLLALQCIHSKGIIHRDLKPENIFICNNEFVKLIDLGLGYQIVSRGHIGHRCGTPFYIAPEMIKQQCYDQSVDIFALGIIVYQLLNQNRHPLWLQGMRRQSYYEKITKEFTIHSDMPEMALDFIQNTVSFHKEDRMTASQCLEHPWLNEQERKSHPITHKEIIQQFKGQLKISNIIKALLLICQLKQNLNNEAFIQTEASIEFDDCCSKDEFFDAPITSRKSEKDVLFRIRPSLKKIGSQQDIKLRKNQILNEKRHINIMSKFHDRMNLIQNFSTHRRIHELCPTGQQVPRRLNTHII